MIASTKVTSFAENERLDRMTLKPRPSRAIRLRDLRGAATLKARSESLRL
jgi:hypothetical protein